MDKKEKVVSRVGAWLHLGLTLGVSELFEQMIEEFLAFGLAYLTGQILSVCLAIAVTQGISFTLKKFYKTLIYREGHDKMKFFKKVGVIIADVCKFFWGNKLTATMVAVGSYAGYAVYLAAYLPYFWANLILGVLVGLIAAAISIRLGGETLTQIIDRWTAKKLTKSQNKEAKAKAAAIYAKAKELENLQRAEIKARATAMVEAEEAAKKNN